MKAKNKLFAVLMAIVLAAAMAAGCSSSRGNDNGASASQTPSESPAAQSGKTNQEPIKLTMWGGVPEESGPQAVVDAWNKDHPDIQVEYVRFVNDDAGNMKLDTALLSGQSVDLYVNYTITNLQKRIDAGVALDLSTFTDYNIDEKMGSDAKSWQVDGKYYGVPTIKNAFFVALNKDLLDEANLSIPKSWTWKELREYAKALKADNRYGYISHMEPFIDPMDSVLEKFGYTKADGTSQLDHPLVGEWLEIMNVMMHTDKTMPPYGEQLASKMPEDAVFLKGEAAMLNIGTWLLRSSNNLTDFPRDFKIAFAPVPRMTENEADYITRGGLGDMVSINKNSKHVDAAWEFLKWYADGGMAPMASGGRLPASKDADIDAAIDAMLGDNAATYDVDSLKRAIFENPAPTYIRKLPQQVMDIRQEEMEKYFLGSQNLNDTLQNAAKRHNDFLKNQS